MVVSMYVCMRRCVEMQGGSGTVPCLAICYLATCSSATKLNVVHIHKSRTMMVVKPSTSDEHHDCIDSKPVRDCEIKYSYCRGFAIMNKFVVPC